MPAMKSALLLLLAFVSTVGATLPNTDVMKNFLIVGFTKPDAGSDAVELSNGEYGADREVLSKGGTSPTQSSFPTLNSIFDQRWQPKNNEAYLVNPVDGSQCAPFEGIDYTGHIALTSSSGRMSVSDTDIFGDLAGYKTDYDDIAILAAANKPVQSISNAAYFNAGAGETSPMGSLPTNSKGTNGKGLKRKADLAELETEINAWLPAVRALPTEGTLSADIVDRNYKDGSGPYTIELRASSEADCPGSPTTDVCFKDTSGDGVVIIDVDRRDNDWEVNNADVVIVGSDSVTAIFRILKKSNMLVSNSSIQRCKGAPTVLFLVGYEEETDSSDEVFNGNNVVLNNVAFWELQGRGGTSTDDRGETVLNCQDCQGCSQFVGDKVVHSNSRFNLCAFDGGVSSGGVDGGGDGGGTCTNLATTKTAQQCIRKLDFNDLEPGAYISTQLQEEYGLTIEAVGRTRNSYTPNGAARVFDTSKPGTNNDNGDPDLGSPNNACGGPGVSSHPGGVGPGTEYENCVPQGNVLVIQESDKIYPDDASQGGTITFTFDRVAKVKAVAILDIDESVPVEIELSYEGGATETFTLRGADNGLSVLTVQKVDVLAVKVIFAGSGSVSYIDYDICYPDTEKPTPIIDGSAGVAEWAECTEIDMYRAGKSSKDVLSTAMICVDCNYWYVKVELDYTGKGEYIVQSGGLDEAYIKLDGSKPTLKNFEWIEASGKVVGWEAYYIRPTDKNEYELNVHTNVYADGESQTAANKDRATDVCYSLHCHDISNGSISGSVTDDQGNPLLNVPVKLENTAGNSLGTVNTDANGKYEFTDVAPGDYTVTELSNPSGYPGDVSDQDNSNDGDAGDTDTTVDNKIDVTVQSGEADTDNDFVDSNNGSITGSVLDDEGNALSGVTVELRHASGNLAKTTTTDSNGSYEFTEVEPGDYKVVEPNNPAGYPTDVSDQDDSDDGDTDDSDTTVDNEIGVTLHPGEIDSDNNFVDSSIDPDDRNDSQDNNGAISGSVRDDQGHALSGVSVELLDASGTVVDTTTTDASGMYQFIDLAPGDYKVIQPNNPVGFPVDISDKDESNDGDAADSDDTVDSSIGVTLQPGETDTDNNFVDGNNGSISGSVLDEEGNPLSGVSLQLHDGNGALISTTTTGSNGKYTFADLEPGDYKVVQPSNLAGYPLHISDQDNSNDGDAADSDTKVDNEIGVTLEPGEDDTDNDFVDGNNGSISGTVLDDQGNALPNVQIELHDAGGSTVSTTTTDSTGKYEFTDLEPGDYKVVEPNNPTGYPLDVSDKDATADGDPTDSDSTVDNEIGVKLEPGEADDGNNFVDSNNGVISGNVLDDQGNPLSGLSIELQDANGNAISATITDSSGKYEFTDLEPGDYKVVSPSNPTGYPLDLSDKDNSNDGDSADSDSTVDNQIGVKLEPGETDSDNDFVDGNNGSISGSVKDNNGNPLSGVPLQLLDGTGAVVATKTTDSSGAYEFADLEPGQYKVVEPNNPAGYPFDVSDKDNSNDGDASDADATVDNAVSVTLEAGETDADNDFVDSVEDPNGPTTGTISGSVLDDKGNGLTGVTVELRDLNGNTVQTGITDSSGKYEFVDVTPGDYKLVEVSNPVGYPGDVSDKDYSKDGDVADADETVDNEIGVTVHAGETDSDNDFVDSNTGSISGSVSDDKGVALAGVTIELRDTSGNVVATTTTDSSGKYLFADVAPGQYKVVEPTNPVGYPIHVSDQDNSNDGDATDTDRTVDNEIGVTLLAGETDADNDFVESNNGAISGSVLDDSGNAISGVTIELRDGVNGNVVHTEVTSSDGKYEFLDLEPGEYKVVEPSNPDGYPISVSDKDESVDGDSADSDTSVDNQIGVTLQPGETDSDNNFVESNKGSITGSVLDEHGNPLSSVPIELQDGSGTVVSTISTDADGKYEFKDLLPGEYKVVEPNNPVGYPVNISDKDGSPDGDVSDFDDSVDNVIGVTLEPGEVDSDNDFVDSNDGIISGKVLDDKGNPLAGVAIQLVDSSGSVVSTATTDSKGKYIFTEVEPGDYKVVEPNNPAGYPIDVSDQDGSDDGDAGDSETTVDNEIGVTVQPGETDSDNNFVDSNNGSITGSVSDDKSNPLSGVPIELKDLSGNTLSTVSTDADGKYAFTDLEPGKYKVLEPNNPAGYPRDVSDKDNSPDGDSYDSDSTVDNEIGVNLQAGEVDSNNDFVDSATGSISGNVKDNKGNALSGVLIELLDASGSMLRSTTTDSSGNYEFTGLDAGNYRVVEPNNPDGYPVSISDKDESNDGDAADTDTTVDNRVGVTLQSGEADKDNNFVEGDGGSFGDPHLKTWRGTHVEFHAECDLVLVHSEQFAGGKGLTIHIRTEVRKNWSFISDVVLRIGIETLEMDKKGDYYLNGAKNVPMPNEIAGFPISYSISKKGRLSLDVELGNGGHILFREYKEFVSAHVVKGSYQDFGDSIGLMGDFKKGQMLLRDGVTEQSDPKLYAQEWQVRDTEEQLFRVIRAPQFPQTCKWPITLSELRLRRRLESGITREEAAKACAQWGDDMEQCIYDVMATGDLDMASAGSW